MEIEPTHKMLIDYMKYNYSYPLPYYTFMVCSVKNKYRNFTLPLHQTKGNFQRNCRAATVLL